MTDKEIDRIIRANIQMAGFISLVKRMREAQMRAEDPEYDKEFWEIRAYNLESEVDEYLKKMEE